MKMKVINESKESDNSIKNQISNSKLTMANFA